MHAGQSVSLWSCSRPHQPHDPHGSPAPFQSLGTHAAHTHAYSPFIWTPPPLQSLAGLGRATLRAFTSVCSFTRYGLCVRAQWTGVMYSGRTKVTSGHYGLSEELMGEGSVIPPVTRLQECVNGDACHTYAYFTKSLWYHLSLTL